MAATILQFPKHRTEQNKAKFTFEISTLTADEFALLHDFIEPDQYFLAGRFKAATKMNPKTGIRFVLIDGNGRYWMLLTTEQDYQESEAASQLETLVEEAEWCIR